MFPGDLITGAGKISSKRCSKFIKEGWKRMAWIKVITEEEATGRLRELYDRYAEPSGQVDNILKIHSLNVKSLKGHYDFYAHLMRGRSELSRAQREMIAVVASAANRCHY
jgi:uncharacterized peroxidase-related enzyme